MAYEGPVLPISHGGTGSASGSAANLINLNASQLSSGTVPAARLPLATSGAVGGVQVGTNITVTSGTISLTSGNITGALGFTPENLANKNAVSGYAGLDGSSLLTASQLPLATASVRGGVIVGSNITVTTGTISLTSGNITGALGYTPVNVAGDTMLGFLTLSADPTSNLHAATKQYVDNLISGLDVKQSARVATAASLPAYTRSGNVITCSATTNINTAGIDGITNLVIGDRILLKNGAAGADNGLYAVTTVGSTGTVAFVLTRTTDADNSGSASEVTSGMFVYIEEGTANATSGWILSTANPLTLNTTALTFTQFSQAGVIVAGNGLSKSGATLTVVAADSTITVSGSGVAVATGGITNTQVNAAAAIAYTKLNLATSIVNGDIAAGAAIVDTKLATIATAGKVSDSALSSNVALYNGTTSFTAQQTMLVTNNSQLRFGGATSQGYITGTSSLAGVAFAAELVGGSWTARATASTQVEFSGTQIDFYVNSGLTSGNTFTPTSRTTINATGVSGNGSQLTSLNASNLSSGTVTASLLPIATTSVVGAVKAGAGLAVDGAGNLTVSVPGILRTVRVVTAAGAVTCTTADDVVAVTKTVGAATAVTLTTTPATGDELTIKDGKGDAATNNITVSPAAGTIDGAASILMDSNYSSRTFVYNGTEWNCV